MAEYSKDFNILIEMCKNGDESAFGEIYKRCYAHVTFICSKLYDNKEDIEEIVQDTFMAVFKRINDLRGDTLLALLRKTAVHNCYNKHKGRKKHITNIAIEDVPDVNLAELDKNILPEEYLQNKEFQTELLTIINALPQQQKKMVYLYYYADINTEEIAKLHNCSSVNVRKILYTARGTIKSKLQSSAMPVGKQRMAGVSLATLLLLEEQAFAATYTTANIAAFSGLAATAAVASTGSVVAIAASVIVACGIVVTTYFAYTVNMPPQAIEQPVIEIVATQEEPKAPEPEIFIYEEPEIEVELAEEPYEPQEYEIIPPIIVVSEPYTPTLEQPSNNYIYIEEIEPAEPIQEDKPYEPEPYELEPAPELEPDPMPIDRTAEILAALTIADTVEEVDRIIANYNFAFINHIQHFSGEWFWFYVLNEGSGDILVGIAEHETDYGWRMQFEHFSDGQSPLDVLLLFRWMEG